MQKEQQLKDGPAWKNRYDKMFAEVVSINLRHIMAYDADTETGASSRPLSLLIEEFIGTVYNEGFRDGKESVHQKNEENTSKI